MFNLKLRSKFLVPTILLLVLGIGAVGLVSYIKSRNAISEQTLSQITNMVDSTVGVMDSWLEDRKRDALIWSEEPIFTGMLDGTSDIQSSIAQIQKLMKTYAVYENLGVFNPNGDMVASGILAHIGKINVGQREYFQQAMKGSLFVSEVTESKGTGNPIFVIAVPVRLNGKIAGVYTAMVDMTQFSNTFIVPLKIGKSGVSYAFKNDGLFVSHPDSSYILKRNVNDTDFGKTMLEKKNGLINYTHEGINKIAIYKTHPTLGLTIVVTADEKETFAAVTSIGRINTLVTIIALSLTCIVIVFIANTIVRNVNQAVAGLKDIAEGEGDLTMRLSVNSKDEVGDMAFWLNTFIEKLQHIVRQIAGNSDMVGQSARQLSHISSELLEGAENTSKRSINVAAAAEEMSANLNNVAAAMEESSTNANMVASAAEQMNSTINEIAENAEKARAISSEAVGQANNASTTMAQLSKAADKIGQVTETITEISEQTNLLALNATIEAARAGEAGKGFAVVANEIKELAKQTAEATLDIKKLIDDVQETSNSTAVGIDQISEVITNVNEIVTTIATAVEEQSAATQEIANNISQVSQGIQEVNENVSQSSTVATDISKDINEVSSSSHAISGNSDKVKSNAQELLNNSEELHQIVGSFKV